MGMAEKVLREASAERMDLSLVIPCFNEAAGIGATAHCILEHLAAGHPELRYELVLVNDGSNDGTTEVLDELTAAHAPIRALHLPFNCGRGAAVKKGIAHSEGDWVMALDADLSYDVEHISDVLAACHANPSVDVVVISPYMKGGMTKDVPVGRLLLSRVANRLVAGVFDSTDLRLSTVTCVVRAYRGALIRNLPLHEDGKELHLEILRNLSILGANIVEIPGRLIWRGPPKKRRKTNLRLFRSATRHLLYSLLIRPTRFLGLLTLALVGIGLYEGATVLWRFAQVYEPNESFWHGVWLGLAETFHYTPHTVVIAAVSLILGAQLMTYWALLQVMNMQHEETLRHLLVLRGGQSLTRGAK